MLIKNYALTLRKHVELPRDVTQLLIEFEVWLVRLGLSVSFRCIPCAKEKNEKMYCLGGNETTPNGEKFWIECGCRERIYEGTGLVVPPIPTPPNVNAPLSPEKREQLLSRDDMAMITNVETVLGRLELQYELRCIACRMNDRMRGIVCGSQEVTDNEWRAECACTNRVYRSAGAVVLPH